MADYDFSTLSPIDFEKLANDLVQACEGVRVQRFGVGRDSGIDGRFATLEGNGIIQAKHYRASTFSQLKSSLMKSKEQIISHEPSRYIICTSQSLSPDRKDELVEELQPIIINSSDILCRQDLNALLEKYPEVEKSHIKLWLNSSGILEKFLNNDTANRSEAFLRELQRATSLFVAHEGYESAQRIIDKQKIIIVSGPPGVGKTTLSLVIAARYLDNDWDLVAVNSIAEALKVFSTAKKQVFIFDDFLGSIKLDNDALSKSDSDFRRFVEIVRRHSVNTRFILTTRKYIYEEARLISETLSDKVIQMSEMVLELKKYTKKIKSEILYNHLFFSNLEEAYLKAIVHSGLLAKIIEHKNYMPRIIEWLTEDFRLSGCKAEDYPSYFLSTLDRPDQIWSHAVQEHLDQKARTLLRCLFLMPNWVGVDHSFVDWFDSTLRILAQRLNFTFSEREFFRSLKVLEGSFVEISGRRVSFVNPSLRDYINTDLCSSATLVPIAECIQNRKQALWVWNFIRAENENIIGNDVALRALADRCLVPDTTITGRVSLYDFLNFAHNAALKLNHHAYRELVITEDFANSLDLDIIEIPKLFEELDANIYDLQDAEPIRKYLQKRFVSELEETEFDVEDGTAILIAADEHPNYLEEVENEALVKMANSIIAGISLPAYGDDESDWTNLEEQLEVLERWGDDPCVRYLKSQVNDYLTEIEHAREAAEEEAEEEYMLFKTGQRAVPSRSPRSANPSDASEKKYRSVFASLLSPKD